MTNNAKNLIEFIEIINEITLETQDIIKGELYRFINNYNNDYFNFILNDKIIKNIDDNEISNKFKTLLSSTYDDDIKNLYNSNKFLSFLNSYLKLKIYKHLKFFYRGHDDTSYELVPSVFRDENWDKEDYYYHEIMVRCPEHFQYSSHLNRLVMMQHYDCPTRLLDVTTSPLVALYFACKKSKNNNSNEGQVFVFPVQSNTVAYSDSDKVLMLACLARFSTEDKKYLYNKANEQLEKGKFQQKTNGIYLDDSVEKFFHEVTTEVPSFKREIKPIDLLQPLFVQPNKTNGRILKQDGAFILNGLSLNKDEALKKIKSMIYKTITITDKEKVLNELERLGIHEAALFPEVDKVANYLKEHNYF
jgi:hypothetical protein